MTASYSESLWYDLLGAEYSRLVSDAQVMGQYASTAAAYRRTPQYCVCHVRMACRSVLYFR